MAHGRRWGSMAFAVLLVCASPLAGQTLTGSIAGQVADPDGVALPGVTVIISGPAMMGEQTAVTGRDGGFRFPALNPGTYAVRFELSGFKTLVREGIRVLVGQTTSLTVTMELAAVEETITVTGESPVVDVRSSTVTTNYTEQLIRHLPTARNWADLAFSVPGITIGFYAERFNFSAHGSSVRDNEISIDGGS